MAEIETLNERIARYRRLMSHISDERALKVLRDLCEELDGRAQAAAAPDGSPRGEDAGG